MQDNFPLFFQRVIQDEGDGFEDVPGDNGGPTCCGITIADVARYNGVRCPTRGAPGWSDLVAKVRALTPATAAPIYKKYYWDEVNADRLPPGIDYATADYAVNSGTGRAIPELGRCCGELGISVTDRMVAAATAANWETEINRMQDDRRAFLLTISEPGTKYAHNTKFRHGWLDRVERVRQTSLSMAKAAQQPGRTIIFAAPIAAPPVQPRAFDDDGLAAHQAKTPDVPSKPMALYRSRTANALVTAIIAATGKLSAGAAVAWGLLQQFWTSLPDAVNSAQGQIGAVHQTMEWFNIHSRSLEVTVAAVAIISAFALLASDKQKANVR